MTKDSEKVAGDANETARKVKRVRKWLYALSAALILLVGGTVAVFMSGPEQEEQERAEVRRAIPPPEKKTDVTTPKPPPKRPLVRPPDLPEAPEPLALPKPSPPPTGRLFVDTVPEEATVMVLNIVPKYKRGMALEVGRYYLQVSSPGYRRQRRWVDVEPNRDNRFSFTLEKIVITGKLVVRSDPPGAQWLLNGQVQGTTPDIREKIESGVYQVEIKAEGYESWQKSVGISGKEEVVLDARLSRLGPKPGDVWRDPITDMVFIWVPEGCFQMGSPPDEIGRDDDEGPVHEVCLEGFWMGRTEVTNGQYRNFQPEHESRPFGNRSLNGDDQPVAYISWRDAVGFARWLTEESDEAFAFRLPTEAEWEYACRGGSKASRFWGDHADKACRYANVYDQQSKSVNEFEWRHHPCDDGYIVTSPVGSLLPNPFGLYDMLGNVWEWCADAYSKDAYAVHEKKAPVITGSRAFRVNRGGSWNDVPGSVRCAMRERLDPSFGNFSLGFRLVRTER